MFFFQRTGQIPPGMDLYGKVPRGPSLGPRPGMEEMEFSDDDDRTPLTEPIYNGRWVRSDQSKYLRESEQ